MKTIKSVCKIGTGPSGARTGRDMDEKYRATSRGGLAQICTSFQESR